MEIMCREGSLFLMEMMCREDCARGTHVDENIPTVHASSSINHSPSNIKDTNQGPLTRSRAKKLQEQVNSFLTDYNLNTSKNAILPKCSILMLLRYAHEDMEDTMLQNGSVGKLARTEDRTQEKVTWTEDRTPEGKVARTDDQTPDGKVTRTEERTSERNSHNF